MSTEESPSTGLDWWKVLRISAIEVIVLIGIIMVLFIKGIEPALLVFAIALLVGLYLLSTQPRTGAIVLAVVGLIFTLANIPFTIQSLTALDSPVEFILNVLFLLAELGVIVAGSNLVRRNEGKGKRGPKRWVVLTSGLLVVLAATSIVIRLGAEQAVAQPGDLALVAQDVEFSEETLSADSGGIAVFVENKDLFSHTFTIEALDIDLALPGSSKKRIEFSAEAGTYEYKCIVLGHEDMKGTLTVE